VRFQGWHVANAKIREVHDEVAQLMSDTASDSPPIGLQQDTPILWPQFDNAMISEGGVMDQPGLEPGIKGL
jgi:hypothetical protein